MDRLTEYFVRHYTLVIDNDQSTYWPAISAAKRVMRESDVTPAQYRAMSSQERADTFASEIGSRLIDLIQGWCEEALIDRDHPGALLMNEIMIFGDSDIEYHLGAHYLPEDSELDEYLTAEDEDDATKYECGFCGGRAMYDETKLRYVHADAGDRVKVSGPGDFVSGAHNRARTTINPADLVEADA